MKIKISAIAICFICLYLTVGSLIYNSNLLSIKEGINDIFYHATLSELDQRVQDSGLPIFFGVENIVDNDTIFIEQEGKNMAVSKTKEYNEQDRDAKIRNGLQTALYLIGFPPQIQILDSLFQFKVHQTYPMIKTATLYKDQVIDQITEGQTDSGIYNKFHTDTIYLGVDKEMYVLGFYTLPFSQIIKSSKTEHLFFILCWSITFFLSVFIIYYRNKKIQTSYIFVKEAEEKKTSLIGLSHTLFYDPVKQQIYYHSEKIISLRGHSQILFPAFLNSPDYFLTNDQIDQSVWGHPNNNNNRLQVIKRLRENLNPIPEIQIENSPRKGYQLKITKE